MIDLRITAAHGWRHDSRSGINFRVDYYAIGHPDLFGLFSAIVAEKGQLPNIGIETAPGLALENNITTIAGYAAYWAKKFGPIAEKGGGELLDEDSVLILAACHPEWFEAADLRHLLAVAEGRCALLVECDNSDLVIARDDLREFVSAVYGKEGGAYDS